jgi:DNA-directed RNA polymerase subunit F
MAQKIISQSAMNASELHAEMKRIKERDKELGFRAQKTVDYLESIGTLDAKKAKELLEKLLKLEIPRLRDMHFHKIIDLLPTSAKDVKTILQGYNVTVTQENCKKIADVVAEFV